MSERQQLERLLSNPNVRKMLDLIASAEGVKHGYNTVFGNQRFESLGQHPNIRKQFKQTDGKTNTTTAAGRYQFLNSTWQGLAKRYGLRDFSAQNQDLGALALIAQKGALKNVVNGDYQGAVGKLGGTWASLPSSPYAQPKKTYAQLGLNGGSSQPQGLTAQQPQLEISPAQETMRLKGGSYTPEITSAKETMRLKKPTTGLTNPSEYQPLEITSPQETMRLKG